jgi:Ca2+:H+ antiporter
MARLRALAPIGVPVLGLVLLVLTWERELNFVAVILVGIVLIGAVLSAVHHAEVVAHRVGEPFGSIVLAIAVTVIEVGLIITLMISGGHGAETLARDTAFAAVMITCNGIVGLSIVIGSVKHGLPRFNREGTGAALAIVGTLTTLTLVLPTFTTSASGGRFTGPQLAFVGIAAIAVYVAFIATQARTHRDFFLPVSSSGGVIDSENHADPPSTRTTVISLILLVASLLAVVGLGHAVSPSIEHAVEDAGIQPSFVGVVIALIVLMPEGLAASRAALRNRMQTSLNLAYGSSIASIGLTIPAIAVASIWLEGPLVLGLGPVQIVLLVITLIVSILTIVPGRATRLQGIVHLILLAAFVFLAISP